VERKQHWDAAYSGKGESGVSWHEDTPSVSLALLRGLGIGPDASLIDIGGGASRLIDALLAQGWRTPAVLDISGAAIAMARARLGERAARVTWIESDVISWQPERRYDVWHDRAAFHFLVDPADRTAYAARLRQALEPGGHVMIATFAPDGPERCSGLPVVRYDSETLAQTLGPPFVLLHGQRHVHTTPWGATQAFQFSVLRKES